MKLYRIVSNNSLYKNIVFIAVAQAVWLLWQLKDSIDLQREVKIEIYYYLIADILTKN